MKVILSVLMFSACFFIACKETDVMDPPQNESGEISAFVAEPIPIQSKDKNGARIFYSGTVDTKNIEVELYPQSDWNFDESVEADGDNIDFYFSKYNLSLHPNLSYSIWIQRRELIAPGVYDFEWIFNAWVFHNEVQVQTSPGATGNFTYYYGPIDFSSYYDDEPGDQYRLVVILWTSNPPTQWQDIEASSGYLEVRLDARG